MTSRFFSWCLPKAFERAIDRWFDSCRSGHAVWVFLAAFVIWWTAFQIVSYASIDLHFDLVEAFAWSQHLAPGYFKHPPLTAIVVRAWFTVFPIADWSFHLLAMVNAAVGLFAVDLIARRYVDGDKRLLVLVLLLLTPFYQFHAQRFSTNQMLLSTWPVATYCFLRSFNSRSLAWSAAAGAAAALAMLAKYYSIFLIAGFVAAALGHDRRLDYLRSPAPWVSLLVGFIVLAPHLNWLLINGAPPVRYALGIHGHRLVAEALRSGALYIVGAIGYVTFMILAYVFTVRPDQKTLVATLWPNDPDHRMLIILLFCPLILPAAIAPAIGIELTPLWTMSAWFLLPIVLLAPQNAMLTRPRAVQVTAIVCCISIAPLIAAPAVAMSRFKFEAERRYRAHYAAIAHQLTMEWHRITNRPLAIVTGDYDLANAVTFYSADHPRAWSLARPDATPWITRRDRATEGWAAVCATTDSDCLQAVERVAGHATGIIRTTYEHSASFFSMRHPPVRFVIVVRPPNSPSADSR